MHNLLKYNPNNPDKETRIIDTNSIIEEILKEKMKALQTEDESEKTFVAGLNAIQVDMSDYSEDQSNIEFQEEDDSWNEPGPSEVDMSVYKEMADDILAEARAEAEQLLESARTEAAALKENAKAEGYKEGLAKGRESAEAENVFLRSELDKQRAALETEYQNKLDDMEPQLVSVVADIFEKVFLIQFAEKKEILLNLVRNAVNQIENSKEFLIKVPKENLQFIMDHKEELQESVGQYVSIEIISDNDLTDNQCIIHTDSGVFDCSLDIQLDNLVRDLKSLSIES